MRCIIFARRTRKEILRDPLSYIFCLGFPLVMLLIMTIVDKSIPKEANMTLFHINELAPGIAFFGLSFVMLFTCMQVSKDRSTALLLRLYTSPMKPIDFILGYTLPVFVLSLLQLVITFVASVIIGFATDYHFDFGKILLCMIFLLPSALLFIGFGLLFGSMLNDKAAPGICSIIISAAAMLGGVWMDVDNLGGGFRDFCQALPFYHGVKAAKMALAGGSGNMGKPLIIIAIYSVIIYILAIFILKGKIQKDMK